MSQFPLEKITNSQLQQLGQVLWSWSLCENCLNSKSCTSEECPSHRSKRLERFFEYYRDLTASYEPDVKHGEQPALRTHNDLFEIIQELKSDPHVTKARLLEKLFMDRPTRSPPPAADQEWAINLAVRVMLMVNCSAARQSSSLLEHGIYQAPWQSDDSFSQFIANVFPMTDHPSVNGDDIVDIKKQLMARKLKKKARLKFWPTDNLRDHLKFNKKRGVVELFHHTAFLKEHLRLTKDELRNMTITDSIKL